MHACSIAPGCWMLEQNAPIHSLPHSKGESNKRPGLTTSVDDGISRLKQGGGVVRVVFQSQEIERDETETPFAHRPFSLSIVKGPAFPFPLIHSTTKRSALSPHPSLNPDVRHVGSPPPPPHVPFHDPRPLRSRHSFKHPSRPQ